MLQTMWLGRKKGSYFRLIKVAYDWASHYNPNRSCH